MVCLSVGAGDRVAHAEAAVDRDDRPGDVRRAVAGQPGHRGGDLLGRGVALQRHLGLDRGALLVGEHGGHVGLDEAGRHDVRGDRA
jgi:hypothetical protein